MDSLHANAMDKKAFEANCKAVSKQETALKKAAKAMKKAVKALKNAACAVDDAGAAIHALTLSHLLEDSSLQPATEHITRTVHGVQQSLMLPQLDVMLRERVEVPAHNVVRRGSQLMKRGKAWRKAHRAMRKHSSPKTDPQKYRGSAEALNGEDRLFREGMEEYKAYTQVAVYNMSFGYIASFTAFTAGLYWAMSHCISLDVLQQLGMQMQHICQPFPNLRSIVIPMASSAQQPQNQQQHSERTQAPWGEGTELVMQAARDSQALVPQSRAVRTD